MASQKNSVKAIEFQKVLREMGFTLHLGDKASQPPLTFMPQSGFVKVTGQRGRALYVAKTADVRRVDVSGFSVEGPGFCAPEVPNGRVEQQVDFSLTPDEILFAFRRALETLVSLPEATVVRGSRSVASKAGGWDLSAPSSDDSSPAS